jgi:hypothetical protein
MKYNGAGDDQQIPSPNAMCGMSLSALPTHVTMR